MDQYEASIYNQAITLAKMGHREQAYSFFRRVAQAEPRNQEVVFWLMYTAPSLEMAQAMLDRAHYINPDSPALAQADQWLTNEKLNLPQPAQGFLLFPPANLQTAIVPPYATRPGDPYSYYPALPPAPNAYSQPTMPYYSAPPAPPFYPTPPQPVPYQGQALASHQPYAPQPYYQPVPVPRYPQASAYNAYNNGPQAYAGPYYPPYNPYQGYVPPVRWGQAPSIAYNNFLSMGRNYRCPYCNTPYPPISSRRISTSGWVTLGVLAVLFFPLAWIGLLMQENYLRCSHCRLILT